MSVIQYPLTVSPFHIIDLINEDHGDNHLQIVHSLAASGNSQISRKRTLGSQPTGINEYIYFFGRQVELEHHSAYHAPY